MKKLYAYILILIVCVSSVRLPELSNKDVKKKIEEILQAHVSYSSLNEEIIERSFSIFLDELDPTKTYLVENEIVKWSSPSESTLKEALSQAQKGQFDAYNEIYTQMISAIKRRGKIEEKINYDTLHTDESSLSVEKLNWVKDESELSDRIHMMRALQLSSAEKYDEDNFSKNALIQKISKRRQHREQEITQNSKHDQQKNMLGLVLKAIANSLDNHTAYFTPSEANQFMIQVQQRLFGIGAQLRDDLDGFEIVRMLDGSPSALSERLKVGDKIIKVNGEHVVGLDVFDVVEMIRGPKGSKVSLTVVREHTREDESTYFEKHDLDIIRDEIVIKESRMESDSVPYGNGILGHIHLHAFYQDPNSSSAKDVKDAIENFKNESELLGLILDLRSNSGGLLPQSVAVAGLFISKGIVASIKDSFDKVQHLRNFESQIAWDGPLIILTNRASASASEIVAQSLQDYGRALIVGDDHTYGKGSYQSFSLEAANSQKVNPQGEYKVTRGIYYTVSGKSPQRNGAIADIKVPGIFSAMEIGESYAKYPLECDQISENFEDDLSDVHPLHRARMKQLYKKDIQKKSAELFEFVPMLQSNSEKRIDNNPNYKNFLIEIAKPEPDIKSMESFGQNDLQLEEAYNVLKDLIFLMKNKS